MDAAPRQIRIPLSDGVIVPRLLLDVCRLLSVNSRCAVVGRSPVIAAESKRICYQK